MVRQPHVPCQAPGGRPWPPALGLCRSAGPGQSQTRCGEAGPGARARSVSCGTLLGLGTRGSGGPGGQRPVPASGTRSAGSGGSRWCRSPPGADARRTRTLVFVLDSRRSEGPAGASEGRPLGRAAEPLDCDFPFISAVTFVGRPWPGRGCGLGLARPAPRGVGGSSGAGGRSRTRESCLAHGHRPSGVTAAARPAKALNFEEVQFTFSVVVRAFGVTAETPFSNPRSRSDRVFSSETSLVLAPTFRSSLHFALIFVYGVTFGTWKSGFPSTFVER